ncbi:MAG: carboxypeptidase-like regulatory domain-containing protein, partial [Longimicrobiales bacterium]
AGVVTAADGTPLGAARVFIEGDGFSVGALTRPDGRFRLLRIPPGTHRLRIRAADGTDLEPVEVTAVKGEAREVTVTARR